MAERALLSEARFRAVVGIAARSTNQGGGRSGCGFLAMASARAGLTLDEPVESVGDTIRPG
jgi:hypothetical protein